MRVCLMVEGQEGVTWDQWLALARACEEHGLEGLFRSDHYVSVLGEEDRGSLDAWATTCALAAQTERIRLGVLVSPVTFRHPSALVKTLVTADHVSGGRVELGLGAGWHEREHRAFGFPFPPDGERMEMLAEQLEVVHGLWSAKDLTFEGEHYRLEAARSVPDPVQRPHPPLIVGGRAGGRSAELAARWADEYNTTFSTPEECRRRKARVAEAWERAGRDPDDLRFSLMTGCVVGSERDEVDERLRRVLTVMRSREAPGAFAAAHDDWVIGTVDEVIERLLELQEAGVDRVMLQHLPVDDLEMVALLGGEVALKVA